MIDCYSVKSGELFRQGGRAIWQEGVWPVFLSVSWDGDIYWSADITDIKEPKKASELTSGAFFSVFVFLGEVPDYRVPFR